MWVYWYQTLAILWAWKKEEFLLGCCSSPSLLLKEVSEALPWSAFGQVDHQVLPWNCVSCYHLKDLKVFIVLFVHCWNAKHGLFLLLHQTECAVSSGGFRWCWEEPNKGCGTGIRVPPGQICYRHWLYWTVKCLQSRSVGHRVGDKGNKTLPSSGKEIVPRMNVFSVQSWKMQPLWLSMIQLEARKPWEFQGVLITNSDWFPFFRLHLTL